MIDHIFDTLCSCGAEINSFNSTITFLMASLKMATLIISLYILCYSVAVPQMSWLFIQGLMYFTDDLFVCAVLFISPDLPIIEVGRL